jgi:type I restriction enzyme S subunit
MIRDLKPYPAYKESGLPWLGDIPEGWTTKRAKYFFREVDERSQSGQEELLSVSHKTGVTPRSQKNITMFLAESYVGHKLCRAGDLVINTMWAWMAALGVSGQTGIVSPAYGVYRLKVSDSFESKYLDHLLRTQGYAAEYRCRSTGVNDSRLRLYPESFLEIPILCPPKEEQAAITRFLDHTDQRIRSAIRAKRKLISLLNEQKQVIIHQAVTRGLNSYARLKPSAVEWLGDIPAHWRVDRLKHQVTSVTSGSRGWSNFAGPAGPLFIRIGNLSRGALDLDLDDTVRLQLPKAALSEGERTRVLPGDLLLSITAYIGSVAVVPVGLGEAFVSQHVACCRPRHDQVNVKWLGYVLLSPVGQKHGQLCMYGGTKQGLSLDDVKNYIILLPPRAEQDEIVTRIEGSIASIEAARMAQLEEIRLLQELRARLFADVVTGKQDVREAAAQLLVMAEVDEAMDEPEEDLDDVSEAPDAEELEA